MNRRYKRTIKLSLVIIGALIFGILIFQNYANSQNIENSVLQIFSQIEKSSTSGERLTAISNNILTEDNFYAQLVPSNIQIIDKGRYDVISFAVNVNVQNLPFDGSVYFEDLYTTLRDENSKI